jgi:hypothetical protein
MAKRSKKSKSQNTNRVGKELFYPKHPKRDSRILKFLAICRDKRVARSLIERAPDGVIKGLCNAAINVERGDVQLNPVSRNK